MVSLVALGASLLVPGPASGQEGTTRARQLLTAMDSVYDRAVARRAGLETLTGEARALARVEAMALADTAETLKAAMLGELEDLPSGEATTDSIRVAFEGFLRAEFDLVLNGIGLRTTELDSLRGMRELLPPGELDDLESEIAAASALLNEALGFTMQSLADADALGIATEEQWARLDRLLLTRAAEESGRIQVALSDRAVREASLQSAQRSEANPADLSQLQLRLRLAEQRIERQADELVALAALLDRRELPTASYRQLAIQATGQISGDVLNPTVAVGLLRDGYERVTAWLRRVGPTALVMLVVVVVAILVSRAGFLLSWRFLRPRRPGTSRLVTELLERTLMPVATVVGLLLGLTLIGVDTTALLAGLGVLGVIVGLALQDTLGNLAAGLFLLMYRPFDVDDIVTVAGVTGVVRAMGLASTTVVTFDHRRLFVPNSKVWGEVIQNASTEGTRRIDLLVPITYEQDPGRAIELVRGVCADYELILEYPETLVFVSGFRDSAVDLQVHTWARSADWWTVTTQLPRLIRERFLEVGIEAPYPRWVEHPQRPSDAESPSVAEGGLSTRGERGSRYELR